MAALSSEEIRVLEQTRQRLVQLTSSLASLQASITQSDPLPPWSSLQSQANIISNSLLNVSQLLIEHPDLLASIVAYPLPSFPGRTEHGLLDQLLRKKLEPNVKEWVERGREVALSSFNTTQGGLTEQELTELWRWAPVTANNEARNREWGGNFTQEERDMGIKNVVTGLNRRLDEEGEEESDEDEDAVEEDEAADEDEMEIVGVRRKSGAATVEFDIAQKTNHVPTAAVSPALPLEDVFRFMMTGSKPSGQ